MIQAIFLKGTVLTENSDETRELYQKGIFGALLEDGRIELSLLETLYLIEKKKVNLLDLRGKEIEKDMFVKKALKQEPNFWEKYVVFRDLRNRGYVVKTALKFGADFRVYERGVKPGEEHAKWVVFPVKEGSTLTWQEFAAKNRVAHSTKKRLLIAVVDDEAEPSYWECRWLRP